MCFINQKACASFCHAATAATTIYLQFVTHNLILSQEHRYKLGFLTENRKKAKKTKIQRNALLLCVNVFHLQFVDSFYFMLFFANVNINLRKVWIINSIGQKMWRNCGFLSHYWSASSLIGSNLIRIRLCKEYRTSNANWS